ncbi:(2Fe-2S)-binding protein [Paenibacillus naphthalenovorans]|uniref:(2Fe-2S)-binding protein n=1 Tax=Paenibacillus naphthalenovorans TaxID=162209 RepID=UPI000885EE51|nr:(2Fe-2S)-binding protein [Paenibacillus naphthalenovorans]SDJ25441.1 carbon-monoxide dehydrogenase small subunit [Paenibacillus naphthalenovorans]
MIVDANAGAWSCTINGKPVVLEHMPPTRKLLDILRDELRLMGTKMACGIGRCGACMVLLDGKPVNSCLLMAYQCAGRELVTIEGLQGPERDPVQQAFLEEGAFQCGYCTSGMLMSVKGLLKANPCPNRSEIEESLSGNLCRCTGYGPIIRAVEKLSELNRQGARNVDREV